MSWFKGSLVLLASLSIAACGSDGEETPTVSALEGSASFQDAQVSLSSAAEAHTSSVMSRDVLAEMTLDEVRFHALSSGALADMEWDLRALATCTDASGAALDTADAQAAVADLRSELAARQVAMITMVDRDTARAAALNFDARQAPLFDELEAHATAFAAAAAGYDCPF